MYLQYFLNLNRIFDLQRKQWRLFIFNANLISSEINKMQSDRDCYGRVKHTYIEYYIPNIFHGRESTFI